MKKEKTEVAVVDDNPFITSKIVNNLEKLMTQVTSDDVNPSTVNAACQCAEKITDLFKLHLELEKHKLKAKLMSSKMSDFDD